MTPPDPTPPDQARSGRGLLPVRARLVLGAVRRRLGARRSGPDDPSDAGEAPTGRTGSPAEWSFRRLWTRRELYTLRLPQADLDLSRSPLTAGGASALRAVSVEGPELAPAYVDGALTISHDGPGRAETYYWLHALEPFATIEADVSFDGAGAATALIEWRSADGDRRVTASVDSAGTVVGELRSDGEVLARTTPVVSGADDRGLTLLAQLQGRSLLVWHRRAHVTTYAGRLDLAPHLDLRDPRTRAGWTLGFTVRAEPGAAVVLRRFDAALTGNGHADPRLVTTEDGELLQDGATVWFLATTRGADIADAFQGVYALDTSSGTITMTGALFGDRGDGVRRNDNAGQLLLDRASGRWSWLAIGHSDHPGPRGVWTGSSASDLRHGIHHLPVVRVALPEGRELWEDVHAVRDGARWVATASKDARRTAWLESEDGLAGPWTETRTSVGDDETGQLLLRTDGRRYVVAGTGTTAFVVRDADDPDLPELGHVGVDVDTGGRRTWPALFRVEEPGGPRWYLLSFDRTSPAGRYSYGGLHLYRRE